MTNSEYVEIMQSLRSLEDKLTAAIASGLASVNLAITTLADQHHKAMLDQERRNSTFADRERVEFVARNTHENASNLTALTLRVGKLERCCDALDTRIEQCYDALNARIEQLSTQADNRSFSLLSGATGYLVSALIVTSAALLTFLLTHAIR
jgi:DNA repair exonuclease SbcCD ATPase subunit